MSGCGTRSYGGPSRARSQSNVIAVVLLTGMVLSGATVVVYAGSTALSQSQNDASLDSATHSMESFDQRIREASADESSQGDVELSGMRGNVQMIPESPSEPAKAGKVTITVDPPSGPNTVVDRWLGTVQYERDGQTVAYQGGGVWQRTGNGSVAVSNPQFDYQSEDGGTFTFPIVTLEGDATGSEFQVEEVQRTSLLGLSNPIEEGTTVTVEIRSKFYQAWGKYFEEETGASVQYDHTDEKVTLTLLGLPDRKVTGGMAALSSGGSFEIKGNAGETCGRTRYTDSYDSAAGSYCGNPTGNNGDIVYGGSITIEGTGGSDLYGKLVSKNIDVASGGGGGIGTIYGDIEYANSCSDCSTHQAAGYTISTLSSVETIGDITEYVDSVVSLAEDDNDNGNAPISSEEIQYSAGTAEFDEAGMYYVEKIDFSGGSEITFDTTDGDILLAVEEDVLIGDNKITVNGPNKVRVYVKGDGASTNDFEIEEGEIEIAGDESTKFWVYGGGDFKVRLRGNGGDPATFRGVIYGPSGSSGNAEVFMKHAQLFGGAVTGDTTLETKATIHYDEALETEDPFESTPGITRITYLHTGEDKVKVKG